MATMDVTFGVKYAIRYRPLNRTEEFSPTAISSASTVIGTVDITQMTNVLPTEFQNSKSETRNSKLDSPIHSAGPIPSHRWNARYSE
ncbi:hypothetical protein [Kibdelosporangium aridum]|uniref:hypothetical protein n=1 Tax=Kibdelosporangium aridum TaxID=2030 RepID=UPI0035EE4236